MPPAGTAERTCGRCYPPACAGTVHRSSGISRRKSAGRLLCSPRPLFIPFGWRLITCPQAFAFPAIFCPPALAPVKGPSAFLSVFLRSCISRPGYSLPSGSCKPSPGSIGGMRRDCERPPRPLRLEVMSMRGLPDRPACPPPGEGGDVRRQNAAGLHQRGGLPP